METPSRCETTTTDTDTQSRKTQDTHPHRQYHYRYPRSVRRYSDTRSSCDSLCTICADCNTSDTTYTSYCDSSCSCHNISDSTCNSSSDSDSVSSISTHSSIQSNTTDLNLSYHTEPTPTPPFSIPEYSPSPPPQNDRIYTSFLSWNIRGTLTSLPELKETLQKQQITAAFIQEAQVHYNTSYTAHQIAHYHLYHDDYHKTTTYISDRVRHSPIPLSPIYPSTVEAVDRLHVTAVILYLRITSSIKPLICLNVYRSPSGTADPCDYIRYVHQIQTYLSRKHPKRVFHDWLINGDLNVSHPSWGAPPGTQKKHKLGRKLYEHLLQYGYHIKNNGQPTRFWIDRTYTPHHSYIDITFTKGNITNQLTWTASKTLNTSDHYQILMKIPTSYTTIERHPPQTSWNFPNNDDEWEPYRHQLLSTEEEYTKACNTIHQDTHLTATQRIDQITDLFRRHIHRAATETFGRKTKRTRWPRNISRYGQKCSLDYLDYHRYIRKKRKPTKRDWKHLLQLRRTRNKVIKDYSRRWYSRKFNQHRLNGKKGWSIANELRDLNVHRGLRIPELLHHDNDTIVATTTPEKVKYLNHYYHRFETDGTLPSNYCWPTDEIITPPRYTVPLKDPLPRHDAETDNPIPKLQIIPPPWKLDSRIDTTTFSKVQNYFGDLVVQYTREKWKRCKEKHQYYLEHLNKDISEAEVRRALLSFDNHKSEGSDQLHIRLLKHFPDITVPLLKDLLNSYFSTAHISDSVKERLITPIIKTGKPGKKAKELRPVSLTSYIGKLFEKIMIYRLINYLIHLQLISPHHFAYLSGRSTTDCIVTILDQFQRNINRKIPTHAIFFDFSSAFDTVQHNILLWKLEHEYFINGRFLKTIKSFLDNRRSSVRLNGHYSEWIQDTVGVPQGGALSPLLYLIYKDNLAVLNSFPNLHLCIYADDLSLFTSKVTVPRQQYLLQTGLLYIQWYSLHHGLRLNFDKTKQTYFKRTQIKTEYYPPLYFSKTIQNAFVSQRDDVKHMTNNLRLKHNIDPTLYLGYKLERGLRFEPHVEHVTKKCMITYHNIHRHLRRLWNIPGDLAWRLFDTCVLSIMDYSSIIWGLLLNSRKAKLNAIHSRVLRTTLGTINGTPTLHLLHHLNTLDNHRRQCLLNSKHFSRILRTPRSGILYQNIKDNWWNLIRFWSASHQKTNLTATDINQLHPKRRASLPRISYIKDTIIWTLIENAMRYKNDDLSYIRMTTKYTDMQSRISYSLDLTHEWKHKHLHSEPYLDFDPILQTRSELYVFTDGSVKDQHGGYGYLITPSKDYNNWTTHTLQPPSTRSATNLLSNDLTRSSLSTKATPDLQDHIESYFNHLQQLLSLPCYAAYSSALSKRCSIDFCEASAIRDAITYILDKLREPQDTQHHLETLIPDHIRVISDSQVILKYISGQYQIRHPTMKKIIDDIHWNASTIHEDHPRITISYQWTQSHQGTFGNEYADYLANQGRNLLYDHRSYTATRPSYWRFISTQAVNTCNKKPFFKDTTEGIEAELQEAIRTSRFGKTYQQCHPNLKWSSRYFKEATTLTRDDIRLLIASRTGHDRLQYYLHHCLKKPLSPFCPCTDHGHNIANAGQLLHPQTRQPLYGRTLHHLLSTCTDAHTTHYRKRIQSLYSQWHKEWYRNLSTEDKLRYNRLWSKLDLTQPYNWTDPPLCYPPSLRLKIMKTHLHFFRRIVGYYHYRYTD